MGAKAKKKLVQESMESCMKSAAQEDNETAIAAARTTCQKTAVKKVYASAMMSEESEVSNAELKRIMKDGALEKVKRSMQAATDEVSTGNSINNQTETKRVLKAAIKESLGNDNEPSEVEMQEFLKLASVGRVKDVMLACGKKAKGESTSQLKNQVYNDCRKSEVKTALDKSLSISKNSAASDADVRKVLREAAKQEAKMALKATHQISGRRRLNSVQHATLRNTEVKKAIKLVMGKDDDPSDAEIERFKDAATRDSVKDSIEACNSDARSVVNNATFRKSKLKGCRNNFIRKEVAQLQGLPSVQITTTTIRRQIRRAAITKVKDISLSLSAVESASNSQTRRRLNQVDRNAAVKTAIKEVMGLDNDPSDVDVEKYKLDAVKDSVLETMEACNEESRENTDAETAGRKLALKQCREATAKKEIADITGKPENDITPTDIRRTIKHATKSRIRDVLKEVEKIPKSSKTEKDTFRNDQIKKAMKEVMGKDDDEDPTDIEIERFKEDGVQDTVRETIDACNSEARDETDATVRETKYKDCRSQTVRQTMADITGKNSSEITAVNVRRHIKRAAKQRVKDEMKAAGNKPSSTSEADRNAAVKTAIKEVMGLDNDPSDVDVEKYKLDAVKDSVLETMEACNEETKESTTTTANSTDRKAALKQCREATAKKEIADITGKSENDITPT